MEERGHEISVSPTERTIPDDAGRTLAAPRFDEKSIQGAQPAVPLARGGKVRRSWPTSVVVLCLLAGLAGGVLGGLALTLHGGDDTRSESSNDVRAQLTNAEPHAAENPPDALPDASSNASAASAPPVLEETTAARDSSNVAPERAQTSHPAQTAAQRAPKSAGEPESVARVAAEGASPKSDAAPVTVGTEGADTKVDAAAAQGELRSALDEWLAATNARDVRRQMQFYAPTVGAFYLSRNTSRESVRAEKSRVFAQADSVDVRASSAPDIRLSRDGRTALMRFRKRYQITGGVGARSGEVLQELRWRRTPSGWRIVGERDLRVIR